MYQFGLRSSFQDPPRYNPRLPSPTVACAQASAPARGTALAPARVCRVDARGLAEFCTPLGVSQGKASTAPRGTQRHLTASLICISNSQRRGNSFHVLSCHPYSPVVDFSNWIVGFYIFNFGECCQSILYILDHSPLFGVCSANVFPVCSSSFHPPHRVFHRTKVLILILMRSAYRSCFAGFNLRIQMLLAHSGL